MADLRSADGSESPNAPYVSLGEETLIKVVMLGPRRAGKTSVLAVMYERFDTVAGASQLMLRTNDDNTRDTLRMRLHELEAMIPKLGPPGSPQKGEATEIGPGIGGTRGRCTYEFILRHRLRPALSGSMAITFVDIEGAWMSPSEEGNQIVREDLRSADATIVAIDAPYLMEDSGAYHQERNDPGNVAELILSSFIDSNRRKLLLLVPVRCEAYVGTPQRSELLSRTVQHGYKELIDGLKTLTPGSVKTVITPVQTTGAIVFKRWEPTTTGSPRVAPVFIATKHSYCPQHSDQPLRFLLHFLLEQHLIKRDQGMLGPLWRFFNLNSHLMSSAREFAEGCKFDEGFKLVMP